MADIARKAMAHWEGDLKHGKGTVSTESGVLDGAQYSFGTRFENGKGTNPEELLASAHAGCFTMQLSALLANHGLIVVGDSLTHALALTVEAEQLAKLYLATLATGRGPVILPNAEIKRVATRFRAYGYRPVE